MSSDSKQNYMFILVEQNTSLSYNYNFMYVKQNMSVKSELARGKCEL